MGDTTMSGKIEDEDRDFDNSWANGAGFKTDEVVRKWKRTSWLFGYLPWPTESSSLTITKTEVHLKRNDCPAHPRECRPFRSWSVAPINKISSMYMQKTYRIRDWIAIFALSFAVGWFGGAAISASNSANTEDSAVDFTLDESFFTFAGLLFVSTCGVLSLLRVLCIPLRLVLRVDGGFGDQGEDGFSFSIDNGLDP